MTMREAFHIDEDDLIQQANESDFGLASGIWTGDYQRAWRMARALRVAAGAREG